MPRDVRERRLLTLLQREFPLCRRPFAALGEELGMTEEEVLGDIKRMMRDGIIRRLGGVFDTRGLGFASTLVAMKVPPARVEEVAGVVNSYPGVTHNYLRAHEVNLWFTVIAQEEAQVGQIIDEIRARTGIREVWNLPTLRMFKIGTKFDLTGEDLTPDDEGLGPTTYERRGRVQLTAVDRGLVRELQENMPLVPRPFKVIGERVGISEDEVMERLRGFLDRRYLRRLGAILYHQNAGIKHNVMGVWRVPAERVEEAGELMAGYPQVSHCHERPTFPGWPYNLYTMLHGRSEEEYMRAVRDIARRLGLGEEDYALLRSVREFKKTSMKYVP